MTLDQQVQEAIKELERMGEEREQRLFEEAQRIETQYPLEVLLKTAIECAKEQKRDNDLHINKLRNKVKTFKTFKEQSDYYETTLSNRELGYKVSQEKLNNFLKASKVRPYIEWIHDFTLAEMKRKGYKAVIRIELLFGNLT